MTAFYSGLARLSCRYPWAIIGVWVLLLALAGAGASQVQNVLSLGGFSLPGTQFHAAADVLANDLKISSDKAALVVFHSDQLLVTDAIFKESVDRSLGNLRTNHKLVSRAESFYDTGIPDMVSPDNRTTYALVTLEGEERDLQAATPDLRHLASKDMDDRIRVFYVGQPAANFDIQTAIASDLVRVETITFPIVFLILVLVFGSLVAATVPLVVGAACVLLSMGGLFVLTRVAEVSIFALNTATMIGLGLAVDFSLILVSRFREELAHRPLPLALDAMLQTSGRSITFSGITLMLTMAVLTLFPVMIINSIAIAVTLVAAVAIVMGLTLLPAVLVLLGRHLDKLSLRALLGKVWSAKPGRWRRWAQAIMRRPWTWTLGALLVLGLLALPALWLKRIGVTAQVLPESSETRQGVELLQRQFGPGEAAPLMVVIQAADKGGLWNPEILEGIYDLHIKLDGGIKKQRTRLEKDPRVSHVQSLASLIPNPSEEWMQSLSPATILANPDRARIVKRLANLDPDPKKDNQTTVLLVYPSHSETDPGTVQLMQDLRQNIRTWAPGLAGARVLVGGTPAQHYDFDKVVYDQVPLLLGLSLLVTFVILMLFFHSLILPLKAILLNLVSLAASYGLLVLVFQFGVGDRLLGFHSLGAILSYTPVLLFSLLFGLSTDYEVFLLMRVKEFVRQGLSNDEAVAEGLEQTAGIITAAGLIMIAVFGSFALMQVLVIKELGFGLAVAVFLDTTLVRIVLVPATMKLMGAWNWWMPRSLAPFVPEIDEGELAPAGQVP